MANEGLGVLPDDAAVHVAGAVPSSDGATSDAPSPDDATSDDMVEAVRAVIQAAIDVGRQVLDAAERTLRDPATAEKLGELVAGLAGAAEGLRPVLDVKGFRARPGPPAVQHITIDDVLIDDALGDDGEAS
jgi:hypothetical protein